MKKLTCILNYFLVALLLALTHCTVQKRLYNRGYHVEHKIKFHTSSGNAQESEEEQLEGSISEDETLIPEELLSETQTTAADHVLDTTVAIVSTGQRKDTIYYVEVPARGQNAQKKQARLLGVGIPLVGTGLIAVGCLSEATAAGANVFSFLVLGAIGWFCALIAAILLIIFLVFLCIPVKDDGYTKEKEVKDGLSKKEKTGLTICLVFIGILGLAFLFTGLNG